MRILAIAGVNLRLIFRDRTNVFFVIIFPLLLIFFFGVAFGGSVLPTLGVVSHDTGPMAGRMVDGLPGDRIRIERLDDEAAARSSVERGELAGLLVIPRGYGSALRDGRDVAVRYFARPDSSAQEVGEVVRAAVAGQSAIVRAARFGASERKQSFDEGVDAAGRMAPHIPGVVVKTSITGEARFSGGTFDVGAPSQLLLFIFLTSLTASAGLIEARRLGVTRRIYATPTGTGAIVLGEALGRLAIALTQGLIIMLGAGLLFGVRWGDPLGAAAVLLMLSLVGGGAAMLVGSTFRTPDQAVAVGLLLGLGLAGFGGLMMPLEFFSGVLRTLAYLTPHAWGYEAFAALIRRDAGIGDILPQLGVLAAFSAILYGLGAWRLRAALNNP